MAEIKRGKEIWYEAWLDTPFSTPRAGLTHDEALTTPGCYVKMRRTDERIDPDMRKQILGRLVSITDGVVLVRSNDPYHDNHGEPFTWTGTLPEYFNTWRCD